MSIVAHVISLVRPIHDISTHLFFCFLFRNAWSKSGVARGAATRCEEILKRMIALYKTGRHEITPDTTSFNTVIHTLAKSRERDSENRAEGILELMNQLSSSDENLKDICKPDEVVSYTSAIYYVLE